MIGITILSNQDCTKVTHYPSTIYRPSSCDPNAYPPYSSLNGTVTRCYIPHRYCYLFGFSPKNSEWNYSHSKPCAYSSSPNYWWSDYGPCSYEYLYSKNQGYYDPCAYGYPSNSTQRSDVPYGLEYLYSYRRRYCDPCDYSYSQSCGRSFSDPYVYNDPSSYGRSWYPSRGYTYRCGFSNDSCGYSCAPGYHQPRYADRRRYSCQPVSNDPYKFSSKLPYSLGYQSFEHASYCGSY